MGKTVAQSNLIEKHSKHELNMESSTVWKATLHARPACLKHAVQGIWHVQSGPELLKANVLPTGSACLALLRRDGTLRTSDADWATWAPASISGPRSSAFQMELAPESQLFIVHLRPEAAARLLRVPMYELTDRWEDLQCTRAVISTELEDCLHGTPSESECLRRIGEWISSQLSASSSHELISEFVRRVERDDGVSRVSDLAEQLSVSRRHLARSVATEIGISPKTLIRITRFQNAVELGRFQPRLSLGAIAHRTGYADQAHMTRDFVELGSIRPTDLRGECSANIW